MTRTTTASATARSTNAAFGMSSSKIGRLPPPSLAEAGSVLDPLDEDLADDVVVVTTRRGICRVALVAAETADRFRRDGLGYDPMSWMLAPRRMFEGGTALEACLARDACLRAVLAHGLSLGLDAPAAEIDALVSDDAGDGNFSCDVPDDDGPVSGSRESDGRPERAARLFTATVVSSDGFETVLAYHASLAEDAAEIAGRLYMRMGAACADAEIVDGFDPGHPLVEAMVADAVAETLAQVALDPASPLAAGLDLNIEQRFHR